MTKKELKFGFKQAVEKEVKNTTPPKPPPAATLNFPKSWEQAKEEIPEDELFRAEVFRAPIGNTGDYDSWIELVGENFNLQSYNPSIGLDEVQEIADLINLGKAAKLMAERYEERISELQACLKEFIDARFKSDNSYFEAIDKAMELLK